MLAFFWILALLHLYMMQSARKMNALAEAKSHRETWAA
jgi:hypothetical protein